MLMPIHGFNTQASLEVLMLAKKEGKVQLKIIIGYMKNTEMPLFFTSRNSAAVKSPERNAMCKQLRQIILEGHDSTIMVL